MFSHRFRVRYAECDLQGVVFNSRYLEYADLLITEYWREAGVHFSGEQAMEFHVARAVVDFRAPIRVDEWIDGRCRTERVGTSSIQTRMELHGQQTDAAADLRSEIELIHVHVDLVSGSPRPVPAHVRKVLMP